jgi:hypothetical protein
MDRITTRRAGGAKVAVGVGGCVAVSVGIGVSVAVAVGVGVREGVNVRVGVEVGAPKGRPPTVGIWQASRIRKEKIARYRWREP